MQQKLEQKGTLLVSTTYGANVRLFAAMLRAEKVIVDCHSSIRRHQHAHHRMVVASAAGSQTLSVPLCADSTGYGFSVYDAKISETTDWRRLHWGALYSAYGKSPFFDYIDAALYDLLCDTSITTLGALTERLDNLIIDFLDLPIRLESMHTAIHENIAATDFRGMVDEKNSPKQLPGINDVPYYQVWAQKHGFQPGLSILDLLFNTGREAIFTLLEMSKDFYVNEH